MNDTPLHFTLREMHAVFTNPRVWLVLCVVAVLVGLVGPFGTFGMPLGPRLAYWVAIAVFTFHTANFAVTFVSAWLWPHLGQWLILPLAGLAGAIPVSLVVTLVNALALGDLYTPPEFLLIFAYCVAITSAVTLLTYVLQPRGPQGELIATGQSPNPQSPLLDRLPLPKRGPLVSLTVEDHYVRVETQKGSELVLMRLGDAIRETAGVAGLQIHRSHWVALDQVDKTERRDGKWVVVTSKGEALPISRSYLPAAREKGLIK